MRAEIALIDAGATLGPTQVMTASGPVTIAGRALRVNLETHAVTAGDVWVFDPATRVLLAGDLVTLPAPFFESACPSRWRESLAHLEEQPFDCLVPGHGAPMHRRGLAAYAKAFANLLDCAAGDAPKNVCIDGWIGDASALIDSGDVSYAKALDRLLPGQLSAPSQRARAQSLHRPLERVVEARERRDALAAVADIDVAHHKGPRDAAETDTADIVELIQVKTSRLSQTPGRYRRTE